MYIYRHKRINVYICISTRLYTHLTIYMYRKIYTCIWVTEFCDPRTEYRKARFIPCRVSLERPVRICRGIPSSSLSSTGHTFSYYTRVYGHTRGLNPGLPRVDGISFGASIIFFPALFFLSMFFCTAPRPRLTHTYGSSFFFCCVLFCFCFFFCRGVIKVGRVNGLTNGWQNDGQ